MNYFLVLRPSQWIKNLLIFLPLILAQRFEIDLIIKCLQGIILFSALASSIYIFNDIRDKDSDSNHPKKKFRPIASGEINLKIAYLLFCIISLSTLLISFLFYKEVFLLFFLYFILNILYTQILKKILIIDICLLSFFYIVRILSGSELTLIESSYWLISFSFFLFLYLSLLKRYNELLILNQNFSNRPYKKNDKDLLLILATCIGLLSILIFSLYLNSESAKLIYTNQKFLWFVNFILFYWTARILFLVNRGDCEIFKPCWKADSTYAKSLLSAQQCGVNLFAIKINWTLTGCYFDKELKIDLEKW